MITARRAREVANAYLANRKPMDLETTYGKIEEVSAKGELSIVLEIPDEYDVSETVSLLEYQGFQVKSLCTPTSSGKGHVYDVNW